MKAIQASIVDLKCDAPGCDYRDDSIQLEEYESYLNAPCPKCGASLLTDADLAAVKAMLATTDWLNSILPEGPDDSPTATMRVNLDGSGIPKLGGEE